uniref:ribosomal protein S15 n=1 Tax=Meconopsis pinnatifolia TaxID=1538057 RepID=UPI002B2C1209|nr:ribosomal protein S15 [Meconopsis pinnatifolia]WNV62875.1 ribosomal protein S15 [Meconopsis pinnatifolia]
MKNFIFCVYQNQIKKLVLFLLIDKLNFCIKERKKGKGSVEFQVFSFANKIRRLTPH